MKEPAISSNAALLKVNKLKTFFKAKQPSFLSVDF